MELNPNDILRYTDDGGHLKIPNNDILQVVVNTLTRYTYSSVSGGYATLAQAADKFCRGEPEPVMSLIERDVCNIAVSVFLMFYRYFQH